MECLLYLLLFPYPSTSVLEPRRHFMRRSVLTSADHSAAYWGLTLSTEHSPCSWVWGLGPLLYNVFHASMTTSNIQHWSFTTCQNISIIQRPDMAPYHQDSLLCIEMMGNGVSRTLLGRVGKAIIYNLFLLWIMDEPIWTNMDICSQQMANTKVLKYLSVHFGRGEWRNLCGRVGILFPN